MSRVACDEQALTYEGEHDGDDDGGGGDGGGDGDGDGDGDDDDDGDDGERRWWKEIWEWYKLRLYKQVSLLKPYCTPQYLPGRALLFAVWLIGDGTSPTLLLLIFTK